VGEIAIKLGNFPGRKSGRKRDLRKLLPRGKEVELVWQLIHHAFFAVCVAQKDQMYGTKIDLERFLFEATLRCIDCT